MSAACRLLLAAAALACLPACTPFATDEAPPLRYLLTAPAEGEAYGDLTWLPTPLTLARPVMPAGLDGERIGVILGQRRLDYVADARWAEPLPEMLHRVLSQGMAAAMSPEMPAADSRVRARYVLETRLDRFHPIYPSGEGTPPGIEVELVVTLLDRDDGRVLGRARAERSTPAAENRLTAIVERLETSLHEAFVEAMANIRAGFDERRSGAAQVESSRYGD